MACRWNAGFVFQESKLEEMMNLEFIHPGDFKVFFSYITFEVIFAPFFFNYINSFMFVCLVYFL